jgi:ABC-type cobalamin/Fe3+-siderophores transport system ATPase subunit
VTLFARNIRYAHGDRPALAGVSAAFAPGKLSVILGPNGAGKSTLLACLAGLLRPDDGAALLDGRAIADMPANDRARAIGLLPQGAETHWAVSSRALVALGRYPHRIGFGLAEAEADRHAIALAMEATRTTEFADRPITGLSGGERARVLMARVLAGAPQWILADEPLANLDPGYQLDMLGLLKAQADSGVGVVAVLHDLHHAARFADHLVLLHKGEVFAQGDTASVITPEALAAVYGIDATLVEGEEGEIRLFIKGKIAS